MTAIVKLILMIFLPWIAAFLLLRNRRRYMWLSFSGIFAMQLFAMLPIGYMVFAAVNEASQPATSNVKLGALYATQYRVTQSKLHGLPGWQGVDISSGCGSPIYAPFDGIVTYQGLDGYNHVDSRGIFWEQSTMLTIKGNSLELTLLHGDYSVYRSDTINTGQKIGTEASHGWSTGCHSHVILRENGQTKNFLTWQNEQKQNRQFSPMITNDKPLKISWYDPKLGGINCDSDCTTMASGVKVTEDRYGKTAACVRSWMGAYIVIPGIGEFQCLDTGGAIIEHPTFIYIDLLLHESLPNAPFGTLIYDWHLEWR